MFRPRVQKEANLRARWAPGVQKATVAGGRCGGVERVPQKTAWGSSRPVMDRDDVTTSIGLAV